MGLWLFLCLFLGLALPSLGGDQCNPYPTCEECLKHQHCGWCSHDVIYKDGSPGAPCAGFEANGSTPGFICLGIFSTEQCLRGYVCNHTTFVCNLAPEGSGDPLDTCVKACGSGPPPPPADVFLCNKTGTNHTCVKVPAGTHGATSKDVCEHQCNSTDPIPTPDPGPSAPVYACNWNNWTCAETNPGNPNASSLSLCKQMCDKSHGLYQCNVDQNFSCTPSPPGQPGIPLDQCKQKCFPQYICDTNSYTCRSVSAGGMPFDNCSSQCKAPAPQPGTPPELNGLWRGVQINVGFARGEWDILFDNGTFKIYVMGHGVVTGSVQYNPLNYDLNLLCRTGPWMGHTILAIYALETPGPETNFMTMAFGALDGPRPQSIMGALTSKDGQVFSLGKCLQNTLCKWAFPLMPSAAAAPARRVVQTAGDHCSGWLNCTDCLAHEFCGWCSVPVIYQNNTQGARCAGVASGDDPFKCIGNYRTTDCLDYRCNKETFQCEEVEAGTGQPLELCQQNCKPPPEGYKCNLTTNMCDKVPPESGGSSLERCLMDCRAHIGPPPSLWGQWRGVMIHRGYKVGEVDINFNETSVDFVLVNAEGTLPLFSATLYTKGNILTLGVTSGPNAGSAVTGIFDVTPATYNFLTLALSGPNGGVPTGYDDIPMQGGAFGTEYILVKGS